MLLLLISVVIVETVDLRDDDLTNKFSITGLDVHFIYWNNVFHYFIFLNFYYAKSGCKLVEMRILVSSQATIFLCVVVFLTFSN